MLTYVPRDEGSIGLIRCVSVTTSHPSEIMPADMPTEAREIDAFDRIPLDGINFTHDYMPDCLRSEEATR